MNINTFLCLLVFCLCFQNSFGQNWKKELDSILNILEQDELFHGQILIAEEGRIIFHESYGINPETKKPIKRESPLAVKSITKAFTASAILILEEQGELNIDNKVNKYLRNWPYKDMTIKHLLTMTSGLPDYISHVVNRADTTTYMTNTGIVNFISKHPIEIRTPGNYYSYQNSNYITLAAIIEEVSGIAYSDFIEKNIINPLNLKNTYLQDLTQISKEVDGNTFFAPSGDGNLYSTAMDLYRFEKAFSENKILSKENKALTFKKTKLNDGSFSTYGLAWWNVDSHEEEYYIIGDGPNIRASIQRYPETNSTFIYVHNYSGRYWKDVYWIVKNIWKGETYQLPDHIEKLKVYDIEGQLLDKYVGQYDLSGFGLLHITKQNGKLYLRPDAVPGKEELVPSSDTSFYFKEQDIEWEFFVDDKGDVIGFGFKGKPEAMGKKLN